VEEADRAGLVPDELMLDVVKAELDRLKGKVSWLIPARLRLELTKRAGSLTASHGHCIKENYWTRFSRLR